MILLVLFMQELVSHWRDRHAKRMKTARSVWILAICLCLCSSFYITSSCFIYLPSLPALVRFANFGFWINYVLFDYQTEVMYYIDGSVQAVAGAMSSSIRILAIPALSALFLLPLLIISVLRAHYARKVPEVRSSPVGRLLKQFAFLFTRAAFTSPFIICGVAIVKLYYSTRTEPLIALSILLAVITIIFVYWGLRFALGPPLSLSPFILLCSYFHHPPRNFVSDSWSIRF